MISDIGVEKTLTIFTTAKRDVSRNDNYNQIKEYSGYINKNNIKLDSLKNLNRAGLKKKELKLIDSDTEKVRENNSVMNAYLKDDKTFIDLEYDAIIDLSISLKKAMLTDNDF